MLVFSLRRFASAKLFDGRSPAKAEIRDLPRQHISELSIRAVGAWCKGGFVVEHGLLAALAAPR